MYKDKWAWPRVALLKLSREKRRWAVSTATATSTSTITSTATSTSTLLLISVLLLRPGRVITRVRQLWRWYFQNVDALIGIATSHEQLRRERPDQWPKWPPSHPAPQTAILLRCNGARVKIISSSRVTAVTTWPDESHCTVQTHSVWEREWFYVKSILS